MEDYDDDIMAPGADGGVGMNEWGNPALTQADFDNMVDGDGTAAMS